MLSSIKITTKIWLSFLKTIAQIFGEQGSRCRRDRQYAHEEKSPLVIYSVFIKKW
jgi:hypothetical protein